MLALQLEMINYAEVMPSPEGTLDNETTSFIDIQFRVYLVVNLTAQEEAVRSGKPDPVSGVLTTLLDLALTICCRLKASGELRFWEDVSGVCVGFSGVEILAGWRLQ